MRKEHLTFMNFELSEIARLDNRQKQYRDDFEPELLRVTLSPLRDDSLSHMTFSFITSYYNGIGQKLAIASIGSRIYLDISMDSPTYLPLEEDGWVQALKCIDGRDDLEPSKSYPVDGKGNW